MSEIKNCPKCGAELEKGFLMSNEPLFWDTTTHKFFADSGQQLTFKLTRLTYQSLEAYRCKKCQLVVFEYGKNEDKKI